MTKDNRDEIFLWLGRLVWVWIILMFIAVVVLALWGLCTTAVALSQGETWAQWVAGILFLVTCAIILREIQER